MGSAPQARVPPADRSTRVLLHPSRALLWGLSCVSPHSLAPLTPQLTRGPLYSASLSGRLLRSSGFLPAGQQVCAGVYSYGLRGYR